MELTLDLPIWVTTSLLHFNPDDGLEVFREDLPLQLHGASDKRKRDFLAGRACGREALRLAGCSTAEPIGLDAERVPLWPPGWRGSISHCRGIATAAVAQDLHCMALGIDIEEKIDLKISSDIQSQIASPSEFALLFGLDICTKVTLIFSAKEALYKALYPHVRKFFEFDAVRLSRAQGNSLDLMLTQSWNGDWAAGGIVTVHYEILAGYVYTAVCIPSRPRRWLE